MSRLSVDRSAPVPLGYAQALDRAKELRDRGGPWTWAAIAAVMEEYHGFSRSAGWWQDNLRGRVQSKARGRAVFGTERRIIRTVAQ